MRGHWLPCMRRVSDSLPFQREAVRESAGGEKKWYGRSGERKRAESGERQQWQCVLTHNVHREEEKRRLVLEAQSKDLLLKEREKELAAVKRVKGREVVVGEAAVVRRGH